MTPLFYFTPASSFVAAPGRRGILFERGGREVRVVVGPVCDEGRVSIWLKGRETVPVPDHPARTRTKWEGYHPSRSRNRVELNSLTVARHSVASRSYRPARGQLDRGAGGVQFRIRAPRKM
jgi:hypothetical protein